MISEPEAEVDLDGVSSELGTFAPFGEFDEALDSVLAIGIDAGSTLVKLCVRDRTGALSFGTWTSPSSDRVLELLARLAPEKIGITGSGGAALLEGIAATPELGGPDRQVANPVEFEAWGRGAGAMLERLGLASEAPYLLVSIGTGTSALRVSPEGVERVGGTALGGGTTLGLGLALTNCQTHDELMALAARGDRRRVDLLISDVYPELDIPLMADATASSFGKLMREPGATPRAEDLADALLALVAENVALLSIAQARAADVSRIVYGGSTLSRNPRLTRTLRQLGPMMGLESIVLPHSGHAGALGSMLLGI